MMTPATVSSPPASSRPLPAAALLAATVVAIASVIAVTAPRTALAQDAPAPAAPAPPAPPPEPEPPPKIWTDKAELGLVMTSGNSDSSTWSLKNVLEGKWEKTSCVFKVAGLKADSTEETRYAVGSGTNWDVRSISTSKTTAEAYEVLGRVDRQVNKRHAVFGEASWQRNEFAGFTDRYQLVAGLASTWKDGERMLYRTDAGLSWTSQDDVTPKPDGSDSWLGLRLGSTLHVKFGKNAEFGDEIVLDLNLDDTEDLRIDMTNWIGVSFTQRLALKVSHRLLFDGDPQLETIKLFDPADLTVPVGTVTNELDDVDMILTAALVVTF